jgi:hypothetical protein
MSGGPILSESNEVIGTNVATMQDSNSLSLTSVPGGVRSRLCRGQAG